MTTVLIKSLNPAGGGGGACNAGNGFESIWEEQRKKKKSEGRERIRQDDNCSKAY